MTTRERFDASVEVTDTCWLWRRSMTQNGYGLFSVKGKRCLAHRWIYEQTVGDGKRFCRSCQRESARRYDARRAVLAAVRVEDEPAYEDVVDPNDPGRPIVRRVRVEDEGITPIETAPLFGVEDER